MKDPYSFFRFRQIVDNFLNNLDILRIPLVILLILKLNLSEARSIHSICSASISKWRGSSSQEDLFQSFLCKTQIGNCTKTTVALYRKRTSCHFIYNTVSLQWTTNITDTDAFSCKDRKFIDIYIYLFTYHAQCLRGRIHLQT